MNSKEKALYLISLALSLNQRDSPVNTINLPTKKKKITREQYLLSKGHKYFNIEGKYYLALNKKNAIKKHKRYEKSKK